MQLCYSISYYFVKKILGNYKRFDTKKHNLRTIKRNRILYILEEEFLTGYDGKLRHPKNVRTYVYKNMMS